MLKVLLQGSHRHKKMATMALCTASSSWWRTNCWLVPRMVPRLPFFGSFRGIETINQKGLVSYPLHQTVYPLLLSLETSSGENKSRGCGWFVGVLKTQSQTYFFMMHCGFLLTKTMTIRKGKEWMECCWLCCLFNSKGWGRFSNRQASRTIVTSLQPWSEVCSWVKDWQPSRFGAAADIRGFGSLQIGDF